MSCRTCKYWIPCKKSKEWGVCAAITYPDTEINDKNAIMVLKSKNDAHMDLDYSIILETAAWFKCALWQYNEYVWD